MYKLLIVDDEADHRKGLMNLLACHEAGGHAVGGG